MAETMTVKKAAMINASGKYIKILLTLLVNAVLARLLTPQDYGVVAVITVFSTFFCTLSDMGIGAAIVQKKDLTGKDMDSLFTISSYVAALLSIIFMLCAFPIVWFYKDSIYLKPTFLLTISLFFNALNMVPNGMLNRDKKFVTIAVRTVVVYLVSALISIWLAFRGWSYYALVAQAILASLLQFVWNYLSTRPRLVRHPDLDAMKKVRSYSAYQLAFSVINYFARNLDNLLTGKYLGKVELGNYNKAYNLMLFPINNLSGVIAPVLHPILSDYQNTPSEIYSRYMRLVRLLFCTGIFIAGFAFLSSEEIIGIMYGPQWSPCIESFRWLSIAIIPQMLNATAGAVFQSLGNTRLLFITTCINTVVTVLAILSGIFIGKTIASLSLYVALSYVFHFFCAYYILIVKGFGYSFAKFFNALLPEIIMTVVMAIAVTLYPVHIEGILPSILVKGTYIVVIGLVMMFISREYKLIRR